MMRTNSTRSEQWTVKQTILLGAICLTAGIAGGWSIRASQSPATTAFAPDHEQEARRRRTKGRAQFLRRPLPLN